MRELAAVYAVVAQATTQLKSETTEQIVAARHAQDTAEEKCEEMSSQIAGKTRLWSTTVLFKSLDKKNLCITELEQRLTASSQAEESLALKEKEISVLQRECEYALGSLSREQETAEQRDSELADINRKLHCALAETNHLRQELRLAEAALQDERLMAKNAATAFRDTADKLTCENEALKMEIARVADSSAGDAPDSKQTSEVKCYNELQGRYARIALACVLGWDAVLVDGEFLVSMTQPRRVGKST